MRRLLGNDRNEAPRYPDEQEPVVDEPAAPIDWIKLREAATTFSRYPSGTTLDATGTLAFMEARDEFQRLATPVTILALLDFGSLAAEALLPVADEIARVDAEDAAGVERAEVAVRYKAAQARAIVALVDAMRAMQQASAEIRALLHEPAPSATVQALEQWIRHIPPCIVGTRADDGDEPSQCICGLNERLAELSSRRVN